MNCKGTRNAAGFTLLEVLVALAILGVGLALTLSLISGSLRNIRKVQLRTKVIQHAEAVMELSLLDESIKGPTTLHGYFEDGARWMVRVSDFELPKAQLLSTQQTVLPVKLLAYSVEVIGPESKTPDFRLHTLKLINFLEKAPASLRPPSIP